MRKRRQLLLALASMLSAPLARAQSRSRTYRIGVLLMTSRATLCPSGILQAFDKGLREHGYVEGKNPVIEWRAAEGHLDRLPGLATELVKLKVDVIVAGASPAALAAKGATRSIPIVFVAVSRPGRPRAGQQPRAAWR